MSPRRLAAGCAAGLLALVLGACSDDPQPIVEPAPTPPASSAAPTEPTSPTTSVVAEQESAKAFIRRWQAENTRMQSSGETAVFRSLGLDCRSCDQIADRVDQAYGSGGSIKVGRVRMAALKRTGRSQGVMIYEYETRSGETVVSDADGNEVQIYTGGTERFQISVRRVESVWRVLRLTRLAA